MIKSLVIGCGAWGTAIANVLAQNNKETYISSIEPDVISEINIKHTNSKYLPKAQLNKNLKAIGNYEDSISDFDLVFIVVPSAVCLEVFQNIKKTTVSDKTSFVICSKGIEQKDLDFLSQSFEKMTNNKNYAVLAGPNFAIEVANKVPTITTIASKDRRIAKKVIDTITTDYFKASYFDDPLNVEICGIIKNIMAIGCGMIDEFNMGVNAKSALLMKGIEEIKILCQKLNASDDISHSAGFGDIFLTCSSTKSRNNTLGHLVAKGKSYEQITKKTNSTFEGYYSAKAITKIAKKLEIKLDLCQKINEILNSKYSKAEIKQQISQIILK
ncbi:MAG: NAD(P)H-dependent glycerol-3-phosphate dehydrogenase [Rickettsiales bacterium]|nr:NAD(P)H-dependent glycerol-3-phosphate dehydrogenase [Rickettsiales bacterium]